MNVIKQILERIHNYFELDWVVICHKCGKNNYPTPTNYFVEIRTCEYCGSEDLGVRKATDTEKKMMNSPR